MRSDLAARRAQQTLLNLRVDGAPDLPVAVVAVFDQIDDLAVAAVAVVDQLLHLRVGRMHHRAVAGRHQRRLQLAHAQQALQVLLHVAARRRADRRGTHAEHVVAGEERAGLRHPVAIVPCGVAGRMHGAHGQLADAELVAVHHLDVDRGVQRLLVPDTRALRDLVVVRKVLVRPARRVQQHRVDRVDRRLRAQRLAQLARAGGVVEVVVRDRDVAEVEPGEVLLQVLHTRIDRAIVAEAGVDQRRLVAIVQHPDVRGREGAGELAHDDDVLGEVIVDHVRTRLDLLLALLLRLARPLAGPLLLRLLHINLEAQRLQRSELLLGERCGTRDAPDRLGLVVVRDDMQQLAGDRTFGDSDLDCW